MKRTSVVVALVGALFAAYAAPARASEIALTPTGVADALDDRDYTTGWSFTVEDGIWVTDLGYWDSGENGLLGRHEVGIFSSAGALLVSTFVGAGTSGDLDGGYRFVSIAPFFLGAGSYVIGGANHSSLDPIVYQGTATTMAGVTLNNDQLYAFGAGLVFPEFEGNVYFNPNFKGEAAQVPEPVSTALFGLGAVALGLRRRRQAR